MVQAVTASVMAPDAICGQARCLLVLKGEYYRDICGGYMGII